MTAVLPDLMAHLRGSLDTAAALDLLRRAIACPSVTGTESTFAGLLAQELSSCGAEGVTLRDFASGRPNVWGVRKGAAHGPTLCLIGHTDTVHVRGWRERWAGTEREDPFGGAIVDGAIWGRGAGDLKAGICTTLAALRTLDAAGIRPAADILLAFVGDEESGEAGMGVSAGMKALVETIRTAELPRPDFAVYVEPTRLQVYTAQMGFFICDITVTGRSAYFGVPELGVDALKAAHAILSALWDHSARLDARAPHPLVGRGFLLVTTIEGGGYIAVPGECRLSLIHKLLPGDDLNAARRDLEAAVRGAVRDPDIRIDFAYPAGRDHEIGGTPTEVSAELPSVDLLAEALRAARPGSGGIEGAPYWSEASFLTALGVPTVYCAPGDIRNCHTFEEHVMVEDYLDGIIAFAAFLALFGREAVVLAADDDHPREDKT